MIKKLSNITDTTAIDIYSSFEYETRALGFYKIPSDEMPLLSNSTWIWVAILNVATQTDSVFIAF